MKAMTVIKAIKAIKAIGAIGAIGAITAITAMRVERVSVLVLTALLLGCGGGGGGKNGGGNGNDGGGGTPIAETPVIGGIGIVDTGGAAVLTHEVLADRSGAASVLWQAVAETGGGRSYFGHTPRGNASWLPGQRMSPPGVSTLVGATFDRGNLTVGWRRLDLRLEAASALGSTITAPATFGADVFAAALASGHRSASTDVLATLVWLTQRTATESARLLSSDYRSGSGWSIEQTLPLENADGERLLAEGAQGRLHGARVRENGIVTVVWESEERLITSERTPGLPWGPAVDTGIDVGITSFVALAGNSAGAMVAAWFEPGQANEQALYATAFESGRWTPPVLIDSRVGLPLGGGPAERVGGLQLALDDTVTGTALWGMTSAAGLPLVLAARFQQGGWDVATLADDGDSPDLATSAAGGTVAVWRGEGLMARRYASDLGRWLAPVQLAGPERSYGNPSAALTSDGELLVVWTDPGTGGLEGLAARLDP